MDPGSTKPSWRSGNTHGFCVTGGHPPIASEPTPSPRLWATAPGATPVRLCEHTMRVSSRPSKPELSTWLETGTFYLAPTAQRSQECERGTLRTCATQMRTNRVYSALRPESSVHFPTMCSTSFSFSVQTYSPMSSLVSNSEALVIFQGFA